VPVPGGAQGTPSADSLAFERVRGGDTVTVFDAGARAGAAVAEPSIPGARMAPGAVARVDDDVLAEGGTRLRFDAETLAEAPAPGSSHVAANSRANAWGERARGALLGAALATAAHAAYALVDAEDTGARAGEVLSRAGLSRALASLASVARPLMSKVASDPVEAFLRRADMLDAEGASAAAFRAAGYARAEDFWGISEHELEHDVKIALPAHRRRLVLLAERSRAAAAFRADAARAAVTSAAAALAIFVAAVFYSASFRKRVGVYVGICGAIAWYHAKTFLDARSERRERRRVARFAATMRGERTSPLDTDRDASAPYRAPTGGDLILRSHRGRFNALRRTGTSDSFQDDDSAFEGSRNGSPGLPPAGEPLAQAQPQPIPRGLTGPLPDDTTAEGAAALAKRWAEEPRFVQARAELAQWRRSREEYPDFEAELAKLKEAVPREQIEACDPSMAICGDYDATYRRFLSAQGGKAAKAEKMLRGTIEWRGKTDTEAKMRVWRDIPDDLREKTYVGYNSGWYSTHTAIGCPVYIERTGKLHLARVLKHVTADEIVDHHLRVMEWMMRVLIPEMTRRENERRARASAQSSGVEDKTLLSPYPAPDKVINLLDMNGLSSRALGRATMSIFKRCLAIDQNYFPEVMYRCYIVNCPALFRAVWAAVKPLLDKRIQKKILIYGKVTGKVMDEMVTLFGGEERVPAFMGGKCKRDLYQCPPWGLTDMDTDEFVSWEVPVHREASGASEAATAATP
jgi:hypothetical protein